MLQASISQLVQPNDKLEEFWKWTACGSCCQFVTVNTVHSSAMFNCRPCLVNRVICCQATVHSSSLHLALYSIVQH